MSIKIDLIEEAYNKINNNYSELCSDPNCNCNNDNINNNYFNFKQFDNEYLYINNL